MRRGGHAEGRDYTRHRAATQGPFFDDFSRAFLERFGVDFGTHFGAVWHQNASKMRSKIDAKIDAEKVMENDAKKVEK